MTFLRILEVSSNAAFGVEVEIGAHGRFPATVSPPFADEEESLLEWYFEEHLRFPFIGSEKAREAAASIKAYGEQLFAALFADADAFAAYKSVNTQGLERIEIVGSAGFHALHWEALKDPGLARAFALDIPMIRRSKTPQKLTAGAAPSPTLNLLLVTARPHGATDVSYRTVTRPLVEALGKASLKVDVDIVRPGTYKALQRRLEDVPAGHYHVVHFDLHGAVLSWDDLQKGAELNRFTFNGRFGRSDLAHYEGKRGFLFFESEAPAADGKNGKADPAEAGEVAALLQTFRIPILILNACQSGKQVGASEASLAARLLEAGAETVLGMGYSVTVSAASLMMPELYRHLFDRKPLDEAIRRGRRLLYDQKTRRAYYRQQIDLEDWLLPVVHQHRATELTFRDFTDTERKKWLEAKAFTYQGVKPGYGFFGRDLDILHIEKKLLTAGNILLMHGMGGTGKTSLLHHLANWWQQTGFIEQVFYFGYDEKPYTRQQIMHAIAQRLYDPGRYHGVFLTLSEELQQADLAETLRATRHLIILDNLESVTGSPLSIPNTLTAEEQDRLKRLLAALSGGSTLVLLGSRGQEAWLAGGTFGANRYELGGLDPEAASDLADAVLDRHGTSTWRKDKDFAELLDLLDGYPLPIEVLLPNLTRQTPGEILAALRGGDAAIDLRTQSKTESLLRCIDYSHGNLSKDAQELLLCLAPFTGSIMAGVIEVYSAELRNEPELKDLSLKRWPEVLQEAVNWGLLSGDPSQPGRLRIQPVFPYFLRSRLNDPAQADRRAAIGRAFRKLYDSIGRAIARLVRSKEPDEQQAGYAATSLEYTNLAEALRLALNQQVSIIRIYSPLSSYCDRTQNQERGLELAEMVLKSLEAYPNEAVKGELGRELIGVVDDVATRHLQQRRYDHAKAAYQRALGLIESHERTTGQKDKGKAGIHHRLGVAAHAQRQWSEAEAAYRQALAINVEFNDRHSQAATYHQIGSVALAQRQWTEAEAAYREALAIYVEFEDRHAQAGTYHQLGIVAGEQRQWDKAEAAYREALAINIAFKDRYNQAATYHQLGSVAQTQRQWAEAEAAFRQALAIYVEFSDRYAQAGTYHQLGIVAQAQGQWAEAKAAYRQALAIFIMSDDHYNQAKTYHQLGTVAQAQQQWAEAEAAFRQALAIKIELNDLYTQASTYGQLGNLAGEQQQWADAQEYMLAALQIFTSHDDQYSARIVITNLARLWRESGSQGVLNATSQLLGRSEEDIKELFETVMRQDKSDG